MAHGERWYRVLYLLAGLPTLCDLAETGAFPSTPRAWCTEVVVGLVVAALVYKIRREHRDLMLLARTDALTGSANRLAFVESLAVECVRADRLDRSFCLVCLDVDNFKHVNDSFGHAAGDLILQQLAAAIRAATRAGVDRYYRLGGDEFAILLPGLQCADADAVIARIRTHCALSNPLWSEGVIGVSAGAAEYRFQESLDSLVRRSDASMYEMKRVRGKSRTARVSLELVRVSSGS